MNLEVIPSVWIVGGIVLGMSLLVTMMITEPVLKKKVSNEK